MKFYLSQPSGHCWHFPATQVCITPIYDIILLSLKCQWKSISPHTNPDQLFLPDETGEGWSTEMLLNIQVWFVRYISRLQLHVRCTAWVWQCVWAQGGKPPTVWPSVRAGFKSTGSVCVSWCAPMNKAPSLGQLDVGRAVRQRQAAADVSIPIMIAQTQSSHPQR